MQNFVTIVSGLPRSGTSMMMQMLKKGGQDLLTDGIRTADEDNPRGYHEFERLKKIDQDVSWLSDANGRAVKMVSTLVRNLPDGHRYKIIFMRRDLKELIRSQEKMLKRLKTQGAEIGADKMERLYTRHLQEVYRWLRSKPDSDVLYMDFAKVIESPLEEARRVVEFLGQTSSAEAAEAMAQAMAEAVDRSLYRNKVSEISGTKVGI